VTRALVLGGGGPVGIGWESGLAVGLHGQGVDLAAADAVYGTSAGSFVGAQLVLGLDLATTVAQLIGTRAPVLAARLGPSMGERMQALITAITTAAVSDMPPDEVRRMLGRMSLESQVPSEEEFLGFFEVLKGRQWPERFACSAVDTATGEFVLWQAQSDTDVWHAVASSCSVPCVYPPVTIGERRYMDGGMRSPLNADVAAGHDRVLVISVTMLALPAGTSNPVSDALMGRMAEELASLRSSGSDVEVIEPNAEFLRISGWGATLMDVNKAAEAYEAGVRQGIEESRRIDALWNSAPA
jgi:NTE family protein